VRSVGGSIVGISSAGAKMGLRRYGVPTRRLLGGHALGNIGIHLHVDLRRSLSGYQVNYDTHSVSSFSFRKAHLNPENPRDFPVEGLVNECQ